MRYSRNHRGPHRIRASWPHRCARHRVRGTHLSFYYDLTCPGTVAKDWASATLTDNTAHTTATVLARTCQPHSGWRGVGHLVQAGHSYTLTLVSHDDNAGTYTLFDSVQNG